MGAGRGVWWVPNCGGHDNGMGIGVRGRRGGHVEDV